MGILIALVPALGWGFQSIVMQKIGGKFTNKVMGMALSTFVIALLVFIFKQPNWSANLLWGSILSGAFWSFGQILQVKSFDLVGVSKAMPISTGEQLLGTTLFGAFYFKEWTTPLQYILGFSALVLIIVGITLTTVQDKASEEGGNIKLGLIILTISSVGFIGYNVFPRVFNLNGWDALLPQAIAMLISVMVLVAFQKDNDMFGKKSWQNMLTGLLFGIANVGILFSNQINGVAVGFTLSQLNVVVATLGGLWILHEVKSKREMSYTLWGLVLVVIGAFLIGMTK